MDHSISRHDLRSVTSEMEFTGDSLKQGKIVKTAVLDNSVPEYVCSCGEDDMTLDEAIGHMKSANDRVSPDTFLAVATKLKNGETIATGRRSNGFILQRGRLATVGLETGDDRQTYIVAAMRRKSETIGRNDPKIKVSKNTYTEVEFYEVSLDGVVETPSAIQEICKNNGEHLDTAYLNGYRLKSLQQYLRELFKWYSS